MVAWYDNVPSRAQLQYLKNLGYAGKSPQAQAEASAAIEEMLSSGSTAATWEAILEERRERAEFFGDHREYDFDDFDDFDDDERPRRARPSGIGYLFALVYLVKSHVDRAPLDLGERRCRIFLGAFPFDLGC